MEQTLNKYEGMFLLHPAKLANEEKQATSVVTELLEKYSANPVRVEIWDERKLAYPIEDQKRGTYVLAHFESEGEVPDQISRAVNIHEIVMRWLCTRHHEAFPEFKLASEMEGARRRDGDRDGGKKGEGSKSEAKGDAKPAAKSDAKPEAKPESGASATESKPEAKVDDTKDAAPEGGAGTEGGDKPTA